MGRHGYGGIPQPLLKIWILKVFYDRGLAVPSTLADAMRATNEAVALAACNSK